jgi:hypothetical protein
MFFVSKGDAARPSHEDAADHLGVAVMATRPIELHMS